MSEKPSTIVQENINALIERERAGRIEHGGDLDRQDLPVMRWLEELRCESLDSANYATKLMHLLPKLLAAVAVLERIGFSWADGEWKSGAAQEAASWSKSKPTAEGDYYVRGFNLFAPKQYEALVQIRMHHFDGETAPELVCNLHESTSSEDMDDWSPLVEMSDDFEWCGPLYAAPVAAAPGIDLAAEHQLAFEIGGDDDGGYQFTAEELELFVARLIDASPKGGSDAAAFYDASACGLFIIETCGAEGKYQVVAKFKTMADLFAFEDARRALLIAERYRRELQATSHGAGVSND